MKLKTLCSIAAFFGIGAFAQTVSPNIGLTLPAPNQLNWWVPLNGDLSLLDLYLSGNAGIPGIRIASTGSQPTCNANYRGNIFIVQGNGTSTADSYQFCTLQSNDTYAWVSLGGSSPAPAFSSLTSGTNTAAAMLVGTGASLAATGSGTIAATSAPASGITGILGITSGGTGTTTPSLVAGTNITLSGSWPNQTINASSASAPAFSAITSGTNTTAAMVVGTGASLTTSGSGTINANTLNGAGVPANTSVLATNSSSQITAAGTTGSGAVVLATGGTLVAPSLGTPAVLTLTNATGLPLATGVTGTLPPANFPALSGDVTNTAGSLATTVVRVNGAAIPVSAAVLASNGSNQLVAATTTGSGSTAVLATSPTLVTPNLGTPSAATLTNATGLPLTSGVTGILPIANGGNGTASPGLVAGTNITLSGSWPTQTINAATTTSLAFSALTSGTNTTATMVVGSGAGLSASGSGSIQATTMPASGLTGTVPIANGGTGTTSPALVAGTNIAVTGSWPNQTITANNGFSTITSGTNTVGTMVVGTGASLAATGSGTISATSVPASGVSGTLAVANGGTGTTTSTGTAGSVVLSISPTLVTPALGTPSAAVLTNATGLPLTSGVSGILPVVNGGTGTTTPSLVAGMNTTITGSWPNQTINSSGASSLVFSGITSGTNTTATMVVGTGATLSAAGSGSISATTVPATGISGTVAVSNGGTGTTTSTGSGSVVLSTSPTLVTPALGTPSSATLTNATGLPLTSGVTETLPVANGGTGTTTATGTAGSVVLSNSPTLVTPNLGTPVSVVLTNGTSLPLTSGVSGILPVANGGSGSSAPSLVAGTNITITGSWPNQTIIASNTGANAFSALTSSTNTTATMVVGTGAVLGTSGSGAISATSVPGSGITGTNSIPPSTLPLATTVAFGAVKPDGSTITVSTGVISAPGQFVSVATYSNSLTAAISAIGTTTPTTLLIPGATGATISTNTTVPPNFNLMVQAGAGITTTGYTLTVCGSITAGDYQIFAGTGTVVPCGTSVSPFVINPRWWGVKADTFQLTGLSVNSTSVSGTYQFATTDVGKAIAVEAGNIVASNPTGIFKSTIASVSGGVATMAAAAPNVVTGVNGAIATNDSTAWQNAVAFANAYGLGGAGNGGLTSATAPEIRVPDGMSWVDLSSPLVLMNSVSMFGGGSSVSGIVNANPTGDTLFLSYNNYLLATRQKLRDFGLFGLGNFTVGTLITTSNASNTELTGIGLYGTAGRGILLCSEQVKAQNIKSQFVRRTLDTCPGIAANETVFTGASFLNPGIVTNQVFGSQPLFNWSENANPTTGVFPSSGALVAAKQYPAIRLANVDKFAITESSIKGLDSLGGIRVESSTFDLRDVYLECETQLCINPALVQGGKNVTTTSSGAITNVATTMPLTSVLWMNCYMGTAAELDEGPYGGGSGSLGCGRNMLFIPPDYISGSTAASSIGGGILKGNVEVVATKGNVATSNTGAGTLYITARNQTGSTGAYAWPAGAVVSEMYLGAPSSVTVELPHLHLQPIGGGYTATCNQAIGDVCAPIVEGDEADLYYGPSNFTNLPHTLNIKSTGDLGANVTNLIETHGYADAITVDTLNLSNPQPSKPTNTVVNAGSFVVGSTYAIATVGTTNFTAIGASANTVGVVFNATGVGSGTGTATISGVIYSATLAGTISRANYSGTGTITDYSDPSTNLGLPSTVTSNPTGSFYNPNYPNGGIAGTAQSFFGQNCWTDDITSVGPANRWCIFGSQFGSNAGVVYQTSTNNGSTWTDQFRAYSNGFAYIGGNAVAAYSGSFTTNNCIKKGAGNTLLDAGAPCGSGGGDTITSPNGTMSIGGTATNTTIDCVAGASGALTCAGPGVDIVTSVVPRLAAANPFTGLNSYVTPSTNAVNTVASSATPAFNLLLGRFQTTTLTANITSFTISGLAAGGEYCFDFAQNGTGSFTISGVPASFHGFFTIGGTASKHNVQCLYSPDGTNLYAESAGVTNQ